ncbi:MAG: long-chain acyl-CoA synthetase [Arenicella sp.]|jgi:long-chain acyl-CoA synthetase
MIPNQNVMPMVMFARQVEKTPTKVYLRQPVNGEYIEYTWAEVYDQTLRLAQGLVGLGLQKGDRVAIIANNCADWFIADFAIVAAGFIPTPIYATAGESIISHVMSHSEAKAIIVGSIAKPQVVKDSISESVITIGMSTSTVAWQHSMADLIANNDAMQAAQVHQPKLDDVFSIVYTSGSTGNPKGVVISFENLCFSTAVAVKTLDASEDERALSYLPLAHVTERSLVEYYSLYSGGTVTFNESLDTFIRDLRSAQPTGFISVPRLWVKFQSQVLANIPQRKLNLMLKIPILSSIVKNKIKTQLGFENTKSFGSGSAPISPSILEWYHKLDIHIGEGWGMSETMGMATSQFPFDFKKIGTIGKAVEGFDIKVSDAGEVLIKGPAVFPEYYKNPEVTAESFTEDGYFRTGDKADIDADGYFTITGRVKDIFKSGKGKYIAPVPIESKLASNLLIEQLCVMGSGLPAAMAVIVLSKEIADDMNKKEIEESLLATVAEVNAQIEKHEVIGGIRIVDEAWTIENGLLTPTMKVKRAELEEKFLPTLEGQKEKVVWA